MTDLNPELIERARRVLVEEGADYEGGWHSWRCFDKERYPEPCDCTAEIARAILEDVYPLIAAQAWNQGYAASEREWAHVYDGHTVDPEAINGMCTTCGQGNPFS